MQKISFSEAWQLQIINTFESARTDESLIIHCSAYLEAMKFMHLSDATKSRIMTIINEFIRTCIESPSRKYLTIFSFGIGLESYLRYQANSKQGSSDILAVAINLASQYGTLPLYLEAILFYVTSNYFDITDVKVDQLIDVLVENLHSPFHILRKLSLQILDALLVDPSQEAEAIKIALAIENSPLDLQSARMISMNVRSLALQYKTNSSHTWIQRAIPHFCFGILSFKLSQLWDEAIAVLKQICETKRGEEIVSEIVFKWLGESEPMPTDDLPSYSKQPETQPLHQFQCSNLMRIEKLIQENASMMEKPIEQLKQRFDQCHRILSRRVNGAPALSLRVLAGIPSIAEKHSRLFVPKFLQWAQEDVRDPLNNPLASKLQQGKLLSPRLNYRDQRAMLDLFSSFHSPKSLYQSSEIFDALKGLLANGDVEVQRSALRAIFGWKIQSIKPYQESLMNLLDDARFRDEISTFLHSEDAIQDEHRQTLTPILIRILYGKMIAKTGTASGKRGQAARRKAVIGALSRLKESDFREFVQLTLGALNNIEILEDSRLQEIITSQKKLTARKQIGLINMMKDMLETLGNQLAPFSKSLMNALLYCMVNAARELSIVLGPETTEAPQISLLKNIRQLGIQCLDLLFQYGDLKELEPYLPVIFVEIISPRLEKLPIETAQSVSGLLLLVSTWASSPQTIHILGEHNPLLIKSVTDCLGVPSAKEEVKIYVLENILKQFINLCKRPLVTETGSDHDLRLDSIMQTLFHPNAEFILDRLGNLLRKSPSKAFLGSAIELVSMMAPMMKGSSQVEGLLEISIFLLNQPSHRVSPRAKGDLLHIVQHFVPLVDFSSADGMQDRIFCTVSSLFGYFKDRVNRLALSQVLLVLADKDHEIKDVAGLCRSLNSFLERKLDEPDFDERLKAFNAINEIHFQDFTAKQWRPLVYNMLFFIKDTEELAIRSNASFALRRFIETNKWDAEEAKESELVKLVLLPALRQGAFESSELVRTEYLVVMAHLIRQNPSWNEINDMLALLVNEDEEASFFGNILHIQQHRRLRALRRLATHAGQQGLRSINVAHFLIPLIEHFVFNKAEDENAHNLTAETILTLKALEPSLEWSQFRALFKRYCGYISSKPDLEKTIIKLLGVTIDSLSGICRMGTIRTSHYMDLNGTAALERSVDYSNSKILATMPGQDKLTDDLKKNLLPPLLQYIHDKDESTVSLRVPVAVSTVKLLQLLSEDQFKDRLPAVLTDVCNILRSRSQESRDITRKTLVEISTLIGPTCFEFILKELRSALTRGYQLHVLSYTVHAILVATATIYHPGDLNYCLPQIVSIIMDDIFGAAGLEKDTEEYVSRMKEVKSSKSFDSMELVSKTATVEHFSFLIDPLQTLLEEKLDHKMVRKIDELFRRIAVGLLRNEATRNQTVLVFCYNLIQESNKDGDSIEKSNSRQDQQAKRFLINSKGASKSGNRGSISSYRYKLTRFSVDLLRSVLHKYDTLRTPENIHGFIPLIDNLLIQSNEEIQISTIRLLTTIIQVPIKQIDENATVYIRHCVKIFKASVSTSSELAQAALKLVSAILRERRTIVVKELDLAYLLKRLLPDLEEPDRQGVVFNFLKAVLGRKVIIAEVYEVLDTVATIMVTNQTKAARDMARSVYFQFIMEYPQGKGRFSKQLSFLARNLDYKHAEGRQSVMEVIHLLFLKVDENLVQEINDTFMVPLVLVMVNDDSAVCREMAGTLLKTSIERNDTSRTKSFLNLVRSWLDQSDKPLLARAALQLYTIYIDVATNKAEQELPFMHARISQILNIANTAEADWELLYFALQTFTKTTQQYPSSAFVTSLSLLWASVRQCLSFPHSWVKLSASKLLETYFADFARENAKLEKPALPLGGSGGLLLTRDVVIETARALLASLRVPGVSEEVTNQSVRNLIFLGKIMSKTGMSWQQDDRQQPEIDTYEDENGSGEEETPLNAAASGKTAVTFMLERVSAILRRGPSSPKTPSLIPLKASLHLLHALCTHLPTPSLTPSMPTILLPLHNLTDPTIPPPSASLSDPGFAPAYQALIASGTEILTLLREKLGTTGFVEELTRVREEVKARREGRRAKRRVEAVAEPEKAGREKVRKGERKKERRREKGGEERGRRRGW